MEMAEKEVESTSTAHVERIPQAHGGALTPFSSEYQPQNKSAGALMRNALCEMADWTRDQLASVVADQESPLYRVAAANRLIGAAENGADFDRCVNHTDGQPIARSQNENVTRHVRVIELAPDDARN